MDEFVWLEYPANGNKAQFPAAAAALWRAKGWVDTDPELVPSIFHDPPEAIAAAEAESAARRGEQPLVLNPGADAENGAPETEPKPDPLPGTTTRSAGRKTAPAATEEG